MRTMKGLRIMGAAAGVLAAVVGGAIVGCDSTTSTTSSPAHAQARQPDVRAEMLGWMNGGGYHAFNNIVDHAKAADLTNPSAAGILARLTSASTEHPAPAIVDRAGAYARTLGHLASVGSAVQAGDVATATSQMAGYTEDMNTLIDEVNAATRAMARTG
jgi:hypothetical protein